MLKIESNDFLMMIRPCPSIRRTVFWRGEGTYFLRKLIWSRNLNAYDKFPSISLETCSSNISGNLLQQYLWKLAPSISLETCSSNISGNLLHHYLWKLAPAKVLKNSWRRSIRLTGLLSYIGRNCDSHAQHTHCCFLVMRDFPTEWVPQLCYNTKMNYY
jgi:hypothetical protein